MIILSARLSCMLLNSRDNAMVGTKASARNQEIPLLSTSLFIFFSNDNYWIYKVALYLRLTFLLSLWTSNNSNLKKSKSFSRDKPEPERISLKITFRRFLGKSSLATLSIWSVSAEVDYKGTKYNLKLRATIIKILFRMLSIWWTFDSMYQKG